MSIHYPKGTHRARITGQGFPAANEYGMRFMFRILPNGGEYERTAYHPLSDSEGRPAERSDQTIAIFQMLGFGGDDSDIAQLDPEHPNHFSFIGLEVDAYCQHKQRDDGIEVERWYINIPREGPIIEPLEKPMARKLNALFGKQLKTRGELQPATTAEIVPTTSESELPEDGDDIPF